MSAYKQKHSYEQRLNESTRIRDKFPGRIPLIVERAPNNNHIPHIDKEKFLVPGDLTVSQFLFVLRNRMKLSSEKALFIFIGGTLPITSSLMRELYAYHKDNDGFMYAVYSGENTFGSLN
jgi:GABA(A) receptor-associated protein